MGVRLYSAYQYERPKYRTITACGVSNPQLEELLVGVPEGTTARLDELEARKPSFGDRDAEDAWYEELFADDDLNQLHSFRIYGWGRVRFPVDDCVGHVTDRVEMRQMLAAQDVFLPDELFDQLWGLAWG